MPISQVHSLQTVFLFLLLLIAIFAALARRINIPYPILLVLAGLGLSFVPHVPHVALNPELVFTIFLPPLLCAAAWQTNLRAFRENLLTISLLAFGLVGFTVWGVTVLASHFIGSLDAKSGFILGAVVATTDAVAATSIAKSIGLPQRIVDILEGESLLNDATGLLALEFGMALLLRGEAPTVGAGSLRLLWLIAAGAGVGLLLGVVTSWLERWIDDGPVEMVISVIVPYAAYLAAERVHSSGVLAVVACGLYMSRRSVNFFSPQTRLQVLNGWTALNFVLNGLVFIMIGLQLPYVLAGIHQYSRLTLIEYGLTFSLVLVLLRLAWVYPGAAFAFWADHRFFHNKRSKPSKRAVFVVGWTGMRGVVALAAALSLPETLSDGTPFAQRNLIVFLTFSVILFTLVLQGLSLPALIRRLGLTGSDGDFDEECRARRIVLEEAVDYLERRMHALPTGADDAEAHGYEDLLHHYRHRLEGLVEDAEDAGEARRNAEEINRRRRDLALETVQYERQVMIRLRDQGTIDDNVLRLLEYELDLAESSQSRQV